MHAVLLVLSHAGSCMYSGRNRRGGGQGDVDREREVGIKRLDMHRADDAGEADRGFEHGEVIAEARSRASAEREVLPAIAPGRLLARGRETPVGPLAQLDSGDLAGGFELLP